MKSVFIAASVLIASLAIATLNAAPPPTTNPATAPGTNPSRDVRIYVNARINDQPVLLVFDTGAPDIILFRASVNRLKLKVTDPLPEARLEPGQVPAGTTEECQVSIGSTKGKCALRVLDIPKGVQHLADFDGLLGWAAVRKNILQFQSNEKRVTTLAELPKDIGEWVRYDLLKDAPILAFSAPSGNGPKVNILIDTGNEGGVDLSADIWKQWRHDHSDAPATLEGRSMPGIASGFTANEVCWAEQLKLGSFLITNVPVIQASYLGKGDLKDYQASLGLFALTRLDAIVDWNNGSLYFRPTVSPQWFYEFNGIGAVFMPGGRTGSDLVAHVLDPSPAHEAGIRNDDLLVKIDDMDVTKWQTDPKVLPLYRFWSWPSGTKVRVTLTRDGKPFTTTLEPKDILQQASKVGASSRPSWSSSHADK